ncbi:MAG: transposase, partial [Myxococcales bacterium]|nr:transposase [Myxococcales bacterium]
MAEWTHAALLRVLERHGRSLGGLDAGTDTLSDEQPVLASCYGASAGDVQLLGAAPGQRTAKLVRLVRVRYRFKRAWRDGTHAVALDPLDFIARLCALMPPPRFHMLRYHGVLAANATGRREVVPGRLAPVQPALPFSDAESDEQTHRAGDAGAARAASQATEDGPRPSRHPWAWLLRRVFAVEVLTCPRCQSRLRLKAILTKPADIARVLGTAAARAPPRLPPTAQLELDFQVA